MYEKIQETASWLKERMTTSPETAIILGTGLGQLATEITDSYEFSYKDPTSPSLQWKDTPESLSSESSEARISWQWRADSITMRATL